MTNRFRTHHMSLNGRRAPWLAAALLTLLAALAWQGTATAGPITAHKAWVRAAPPTAPNGAAYMVLQNTGDRDDAVVSVRTDVAETAELHHVRKTDGMMEMYQVQSVDVPAGGRAVFKPGSYHFMLIGLNAPLQPGGTVTLHLTFRSGETLTVTAPIREGQGGMKKMNHGKGMGHGNGMNK